MTEEVKKEETRIVKISYVDDKEVNIALPTSGVELFLDAIERGVPFFDKRTNTTIFVPKLSMRNVRFISDSKYVPPQEQEIAKEENKKEEVVKK